MAWKEMIVWLGLGLAIILAGIGVWGKATIGTIQTVLLFMAALILLGSVGWKKLQDKKVDITDVGNAIMVVFGVIVLIAAFVSIQFIQVDVPTIITQLASAAVVITGGLIGYNGVRASM
jgi:hypothetical protein